MSKIYNIRNTEGTLTIPIVPFGINGSNKDGAAADVNLIGQGATVWGESFNESLYRIAESFACPQKESGDVGYDPAIAKPKDEDDLGSSGLGINNPIKGQLWFNTDSNKMMVQGTTEFGAIDNVTAGITAPTTPTVGDLWFDTAVPQLKIYDGNAIAFVSVADRYVLKTGDTMTGSLKIEESGFGPSIVFSHGGAPAVDEGKWRVGISGLDEFSLSTLNDAEVASSPFFRATRSTGMNIGQMIFQGNVSTSAVEPIDDDHFTRKDYVDDNFLDLRQTSVQTMNGTLTIDVGDLNLNSGNLNLNGNLSMTSKLITVGDITINEGFGNVALGPDIAINSAALFAATDGIYLNVNKDSSAPGSLFRVSTGADIINGSETGLFQVAGTGEIKTLVADYELQVTNDDVIPNKKYVDDKIAELIGVIPSAPEFPTGTIVAFAGNAVSNVPPGWLLCNGQSLNVAAYNPLFSVIVYIYGGSGLSFNVPDFRGRFPAGVGTTSPVPGNGSGSVSLGQESGQWYTKLTSTNELPVHNHGGGSHFHWLVKHSSSGTGRLPGTYSSYALAEYGGSAGYADYALRASSSSTPNALKSSYSGTIISSQGSSQAFGTYPPFLGVNFIIKT